MLNFLFGKSHQQKINELTTQSIRMQQEQLNHVREQLKRQIVINRHLMEAISSLQKTVLDVTKRH